MNRRMARSGAALTLAGGLLFALAPAAWAPHVPQLQVTPTQVQPGQEVTVAGTRGFGFTNPVEVRFNAIDGPVLGSFQPANESYAPWGPGTVRIPEGTKPGTYYLWATQTLSPVEKHIRGVPARAVIQVLGPGGQPAVGEQLGTPGNAGQPGYVTEEGPSGWSLALVGLGVAGVAVFAAGLISLAGARQPHSAQRRPGAASVAEEKRS